MTKAYWAAIDGHFLKKARIWNLTRLLAKLRFPSKAGLAIGNAVAKPAP
ncbi:MAG: hypothetical protein AB1408_06395 [Pseudomonadota bacterium]|jgi:hypothetical protein